MSERAGAVQPYTTNPLLSSAQGSFLATDTKGEAERQEPPSHPNHATQGDDQPTHPSLLPGLTLSPTY